MTCESEREGLAGLLPTLEVGSFDQALSLITLAYLRRECEQSRTSYTVGLLRMKRVPLQTRELLIRDILSFGIDNARKIIEKYSPQVQG